MVEPTVSYVDCKPCRRCEQIKPLGAFTRRRDRPGEAYMLDCKVCASEVKRLRAWAAPPDDPQGASKVCTKCGERKEADGFGWCRRRRKNICRTCENARNVERKDSKRTKPKRPPSAPVVDGKRMCRACNTERPAGEFARCPDGHYKPDCNTCGNAAKRARWREDPEYRARMSAYRAKHYDANREKVIAAVVEYDRRRRDDPAWIDRKRRTSQAWRLANPERFKANNDRWRANNQQRDWEQRRRAQDRRRARRRSLPVESYSVQQLIERDGTACILCTEEIDLTLRYPDVRCLTVDHLEPLSWPDSAGDVPSNCGLAHFSCNSSRGNKPHPAAARKRAELLAAESIEAAM